MIRILEDCNKQKIIKTLKMLKDWIEIQDSFVFHDTIIQITWNPFHDTPGSAVQFDPNEPFNPNISWRNFGKVCPTSSSYLGNQSPSPSTPLSTDSPLQDSRELIREELVILFVLFETAVVFLIRRTTSKIPKRNHIPFQQLLLILVLSQPFRIS